MKLTYKSKHMKCTKYTVNVMKGGMYVEYRYITEPEIVWVFIPAARSMKWEEVWYCIPKMCTIMSLSLIQQTDSSSRRFLLDVETQLNCSTSSHRNIRTDSDTNISVFSINLKVKKHKNPFEMKNSFAVLYIEVLFWILPPTFLRTRSYVFLDPVLPNVMEYHTYCMYDPWCNEWLLRRYMAEVLLFILIVIDAYLIFWNICEGLSIKNIHFKFLVVFFPTSPISRPNKTWLRRIVDIFSKDCVSSVVSVVVVFVIAAKKNYFQNKYFKLDNSSKVIFPFV